MNRDAFEDALQEAAQAAVEALARAGLSLAGDAGVDLLDAIHEALEDVLREHGLEPDEGGDVARQLEPVVQRQSATHPPVASPSLTGPPSSPKPPQAVA